MKLVVIGGVAGGASAAARMRRLDEKAEILVLERGEHVSFSNCCLPYYLSGVVKNSKSLVLMDPEKFESMHHIEMRVRQEVISIQKKEKKVLVRDCLTGKCYEEFYDKLILSPGAVPIRPESILGVDREEVFTVRNVSDIENLKKYIDQNACEKIAVIGAGFIGIECVENLKRAGKEVVLIEAADQVMMPFDFDMAQTLHKELLDQGIEMHLSCKVTVIKEKSILVTTNEENKIITAEAIVLAIGVKPENMLAKEAGLEIGCTGGIKVNEVFQTSDPDIYAVGDAVELCNRLTGLPGRLPLAGPAQRQARAAVDNIMGKRNKRDSYMYIGSACVRVFNLNAACTGLNQKEAEKAGIAHSFAYVLPQDRVGLMPQSNYMGFKLIFEVPTGKIIGAQAIGKGDVVQRINTIAAMITMGAVLEDLKELELCYAPVFGTAKDAINMAALVGVNLLHGELRQIPVTEARKLVEEGAYILDVREKGEFIAGHLKTAHNIPLSQLRQRIQEIPKDREIYLHCRTSQRSYYAIQCLKGAGYENVVNISGSFLGICLYEFYNDQVQGREPIVTEYNFC